jgi:DNA-binding transcriptional LysR family regulator
MRSDEGYAKTLYESHGMAPPAVGSVVNSTLALLSLVGSGDFVGLLPQQAAQHPLCTRYLQVVPVAEKAWRSRWAPSCAATRRCRRRCGTSSPTCTARHTTSTPAQRPANEKAALKRAALVI